MSHDEFDDIKADVVSSAVEAAKLSPCRSKRGAVIFTSSGLVISLGNNDQPPGFFCTSDDACKATCRKTAVHAEQEALLAAGNRANGHELLHVKVVDGIAVPSGRPSCVQCSKLMVMARLSGIWLLHDGGWRRYSTPYFHALSMMHDHHR